MFNNNLIKHSLMSITLTHNADILQLRENICHLPFSRFGKNEWRRKATTPCQSISVCCQNEITCATHVHTHR